MVSNSNAQVIHVCLYQAIMQSERVLARAYGGKILGYVSWIE